MTIQAVFFDMGGTIQTFWHTRELRLQATPGLQRQLLVAGIDLQFRNGQVLDMVTAGLERYHQWSMQNLDELSPQRVWREYILADYPVDPKRLDVIAEELMLYLETHYYHREMRPEIPAVLDAIQKMGLKIGIISNVCSRGQVPSDLAKYGIRHYFNPVVLSSEYGRRKPDPAIFHYAARLANAPTSRCAYVGDRISRDIVGARRAGYQLAVQIRHDFEHGEEDTGAAPDAVIGGMTELLDILRAELDRPTHDTAVANTHPRPICALLFDAGDILYHRPYKQRKLAAFLNKLALPAEPPSEAERKSLENRAFQGQLSQDQYWEALLRLYGITQSADIERGKRILDEEGNNVQVFEGVCETLSTLKDRGYLLGVVTDTAFPISAKLRWFERGGFGDVWDSIISSKELRTRKPDPNIYRAALLQLGVRAEQAAFVGHSASELNGARAVGMKTIAFNNEKEAKADFYIGKFADLLKVPIII